MVKFIKTLFLTLITIATAQSAYAENEIIAVSVASPDINVEHYYSNNQGFQNKPQLASALQFDAQQGNFDAQFLLGESYRSGNGVAKNDTVALMWYIISSESGYRSAEDKINFTEQYMALDQISLAYKLASKWLDTHQN